MDNINIPRSQLVANTFHLFYGSAKSALLPFLTLFFRQLGLSATQVGIIIATRSVLSVMFSSMWISCASSCDKKRSVFMMSIFSSMVMCLLLSLIPSNTLLAPKYCMSVVAEGESFNVSQFGDKNSGFTVPSSTTVQSDVEGSNNSPENIPSKFSTLAIMTPTPKMTLTPKIVSISSATETPAVTEAVIIPQETQIPVVKMNATQIQNLRNITDKPETPSLWNILDDSQHKLLEQLGMNETQVNSFSAQELEDLITAIISANDDAQKDQNKNKRHKRDFASPIKTLKDTLSAFENTAFILVLCIIVLGEVFSCPTEKLADKIWFDFLDGLDLIEKYGSQKAWYVLGFVLVPICVTLGVDYTPCILPHNINHFNIHFYTYAGLMGMTFIWAFVYPILQSNKRIERPTKLLKGMKVLFADAHGFSFSFTVLLLGLVTAAIDNFMFWMVQDLGGTERLIGAAIAIAAAFEFVLYVLMKWFLVKISHVGAIIMALLLMSARLVIFSYMWAPYVMLIMAPFHAFTHTLIMGSAENNPEFKINPYIMDRSARSVLYGIYLSVGYATGSVLSGYLNDLVGLAIVYQGGAIMCTVWCVLFALIHKCSKRKTKVRYARLLQAEEDQISDDESMDDDWLEAALKHEK